MKKDNINTYKILIAVYMIVMLLSCGVEKTVSQVTDKDGNVYKTVKINNQEWMSENLNVEHYRNGDIIPQVQDEDTWYKLKTGAWCYYEHETENGKTYGKLYNWHAVNDPRGLAPEGWHIPVKTEWSVLIEFLGGESKAGGKMKDKTLWYEPNTSATNKSGFSAYPGGYRVSSGQFYNKGKLSHFWASNELEKDFAHTVELYYYKPDAIMRINLKVGGLSVRCIKD